MELKRTIGTFPLLLAAMGGIVGSGWLLGPFFAAKLAGPAAILAWIIGGCLMMVIALTFAELASSFPFAGGTARFLQLSHGSLVSFSMAWIAWLASLAVAPIETVALLTYADAYLPWLMRNTDGTHVLTLAGIGVAAVLLFVLCVFNSLGVKLLAKTNAFVVVLKLLVPAATIVILLSVSFHPHNFIVDGFAPVGLKGILTALPAAGVIFSFIGYSPAIQLAGEAKNPSRSIPVAVIGGLALCIVLYVLLQIVFIGALDANVLRATNWMHLTFQGDAGPFAGIALAVGLGWLAKILFVDAAVSPFGTALIYTATAARMCYALGKNGFLPASMLKINRFGIPVRIIILNFAIGMFLFLPFPTWQKMMGFLVSALVFAYAVGPLSLVVLRKTLPDHPRPFKVPLPQLFCLLAFYICNLIIFWTGWMIVSKMLIAIAIGYVVLFFYKRSNHGANLHLHWRNAWWVFCYIGLIGLLTWLGGFGGGLDVIPFGWDFAVIALASWIIFEMAKRSSLGEAHAQELIDEAVELL